MPEFLATALAVVLWCAVMGGVAWIWYTWVGWSGPAWRVLPALVATVLLCWVFDWGRRLLGVKYQSELDWEREHPEEDGDEGR